MGIDPKTLSDRQVDMIGDAKQRKAVVKARGFETTAKTAAKKELEREIEMHNQYISFLRRNEFGYIHADPTKPSTIKKGAPDFCVTKGPKYLYGEFKRPDGVLSPAQKEYFAFLQRIGCPLFIWYDYATAIRDTAAWFELPSQEMI